MGGNMTGMPLILASASPRRAELLANAGIAFVIRPAHVPEIHNHAESPADYVRRLARAKAAAVEATEDEVVLGADTTVVAAGEVLEKPADAADARRMLALLSGRAHHVITGICLRRGASYLVDAQSTEVCFADLTQDDIDAYVASGEPFDKAGAYAIQGLASRFVERIDGCYFNVVGLPVPLVWKRLREFEELSSYRR